MKKEFSKEWIRSKQPRKQRKYRYNAPKHILHKFLGAHLSKELRQKYSTRAVPIRKGDKVKVMRGQFKKKTGQVENINMKRGRIYVTGVDQMKKDGGKALYPLQPSNVMIIELKIDDKRRQEMLERKKKTAVKVQKK